MPDWLRTGLMGLQIGAGLVTIILVLLHSPKGDGVGGLGGGVSQIFSSQRGAEATLDRITYWAVGLFFGASFLLGHFG